MSLIPAFEIGVSNAWVLTLYLPLHPLLIMLIVKDATKKMETPAYNKTEKIISIFTTILFFLLFIYSIFLPLRLGTIWFYIGLAVCLLGVIAWTIAMVNIANIPLGEPWTKGLYRYSRHPMVLASFLVLIGAGVASVSWLFLLFSLVFIILSLALVRVEECFCLDKFGDAYREYMNRTPRWVGIAKSGKGD